MKTVSADTEVLNVNELQQSEQNVQLSRYLFAGYNTLCLPMTVSADQMDRVAKGLKLERLVAIQQEGSTLCMYFMDCTNEGIQAGVPYLVYSPTNQTMRVRSSNASSLGTDLVTIRMNDNRGNTVRFSSSWESIEEEGRYGIPAKQDVTPLESVLIRTTGDKTFLPTRCGFVLESQAGSTTNLTIKHIKSLDEVSTGIQTLRSNVTLPVDVYDVNGVIVRKQVSSRNALEGLPRGIYVVGGEKVSVR